MILRFIYKLIPKKITSRIEQKIISDFKASQQIEDDSIKKFHCPVCLSDVKDFDQIPKVYLEKYDEIGFVQSLFSFETLNFLNYSCPCCYSSDRNRLIALYLENELHLNNLKENSFLDIAPDSQLRKYIKNKIGSGYRTADLNMTNVDDKLDICDMNIYQESIYDYILCSHVLEHVEDDVKAMSEFYRVLKKGGKAILLVPILLTLEEDFEDPKINTEEQRWRYYGLGDHLRLHSKNGFVKKLKNVGFTVHQHDIHFFGQENYSKFGINTKSVLYIAEK
jgi:SAM-dependent methyltransferase